jgi:hypothetical protein
MECSHKNKNSTKTVKEMYGKISKKNNKSKNNALCPKCKKGSKIKLKIN